MLETGLTLPDFLDTAAILCGALVGAMGATRKDLDWLGVFIVAFCTGVGGGLVRDVLLQSGTPVILQHPSYQLYAGIGAVAGIFFAKGAARFNRAYQALDTLMIGVWVILACAKAQTVGLTPIAVIVVGTIAAIGGGMVRDILIHETAAVVQAGYWYTLCAFGAAIMFVALSGLGTPLAVAQIAAIVTASGMRWASLHYHIRTPTPYDMTDQTLRLLHLDRL
ncbi:MAG: TRIC cation channel family protein [Actinomycetes bacterium]